MSATLTWFSSGLGVKLGTTRADFITDLNNLVVTKVADANFKWEVASVSVAGNPNWLCLKRKSGAAGRILIVAYTAAPAGANTALFDVAAGSILTTGAYIAWFPAGNVDTPSNLTAASGTILGDDTGVVKAANNGTTNANYPALFQHYYFDSDEGIWFFQTNPAASTIGYMAAGDLLVDGSDVAYGATIGGGGSGTLSWSASGATQHLFSATTISAGASTQVIRTNYGSSNRTYYNAYSINGVWAASAASPTDIMTDTALNKAWFLPVAVIGNTKGEGPILKHRQVAFGPAVTGSFTVYSTTGPAVQARHMSGNTVVTTGIPWLTNFKL
jgi:hypothetical protein